MATILLLCCLFFQESGPQSHQDGESSAAAPPALLKAAKDASEQTREKALRKLLDLPVADDETIRVFVNATRDPSPAVRRIAYGALGDRFLHLGRYDLDDPDAPAIAAPPKLDVGELSDVFLRGLDDPEGDIQLESLAALNDLLPPSRLFVARLCRLASDESPALQTAAMAGIRRMGPFASAASESLFPMTRDADIEIRVPAAAALLAIGKHEQLATAVLLQAGLEAKQVAHYFDRDDGFENEEPTSRIDKRHGEAMK